MSNKRCPLEEQGRIFIFLKATRREKKGTEMIIGVATEEEVRERERVAETNLLELSSRRRRRATRAQQQRREKENILGGRTGVLIRVPNPNYSLKQRINTKSELQHSKNCLPSLEDQFLLAE
jgi:hypothetical protein